MTDPPHEYPMPFPDTSYLYVCWLTQFLLHYREMVFDDADDVNFIQIFISTIKFRIFCCCHQHTSQCSIAVVIQVANNKRTFSCSYFRFSFIKELFYPQSYTHTLHVCHEGESVLIILCFVLRFKNVAP